MKIERRSKRSKIKYQPNETGQTNKYQQRKQWHNWGDKASPRTKNTNNKTSYQASSQTTLHKQRQAIKVNLMTTLQKKRPNPTIQKSRTAIRTKRVQHHNRNTYIYLEAIRSRDWKNEQKILVAPYLYEFVTNNGTEPETLRFYTTKGDVRVPQWSLLDATCCTTRKQH